MSDERSAGSRPGPKTESGRPGDRAEPQDVAPADVTIVDEDVSVVVEPSSATVADPAGDSGGGEAADGADLLAMSERLRKVEEELAGVFETVGRLLGRIEGLESERRGDDDPA